MARGRKAGPTRMDMRRQSEAAEARDAEVVKDDDEEKDDEEESDDDDDDEKDDEAEEAAAEDDESAASDDDDDDDEDKPKKKKAKPKKAPAVKKPAVKRTRAVKEIRMKATWVVLDNGSKIVESFPFNQKADAEELLARKIEEKKATFYLQLVKEPLE